MCLCSRDFTAYGYIIDNPVSCSVRSDLPFAASINRMTRSDSLSGCSTETIAKARALRERIRWLDEVRGGRVRWTAAKGWRMQEGYGKCSVISGKCLLGFRITPDHRYLGSVYSLLWPLPGIIRDRIATRPGSDGENTSLLIPNGKVWYISVVHPETSLVLDFGKKTPRSSWSIATRCHSLKRWSWPRWVACRGWSEHLRLRPICRQSLPAGKMGALSTLD